MAAASRATRASLRGLAPFAVVGPGRVGTALAQRLTRAGLPCLGLLGRSRRHAAAALRQAGQGRVLDSLAQLSDAAVVVLAVPDPELHAVARAAAAAGAVRPGALWLHCSGFFDRRVLAPLRRRGARTGGLHPLCPFPDARRGARDLPDCFVLLEADAADLPRLRRLARLLGSPIATLPSSRKPLYHAGAVLGSNYMVLLLELARRCVARALGPGRTAAATARAAVTRLAQAAIRQGGERGPAAALTGPVRRGDAARVRAHLRALAAEPAAQAVYAQLAAATASWLAAAGVLPPTVVRALHQAVRRIHG